MKKVQLFDFKGHDVRLLTDEDGNPWLMAKDVCEVLALGNVSLALKGNEKTGHVGLDDDEKLMLRFEMSGQNRNMWFVNESGLYSLVFKSHHPDAKVFRKHVTSVILPSIRKTGSYSLHSQLLPAPRNWEKTFPSEFMKNVLKLYGQQYDPKKGTPQFVGHFINKYVYNCMDRNMARELKAARNRYSDEDEVAFLHQFLAEPAREALQSHIMALNTLMSASSNKDHFELMYDRVYVHKNQLEMHLR